MSLFAQVQYRVFFLLAYCLLQRISTVVSIVGIICEALGVLCESQGFDAHYANVYLEAIDFVSIR